MLIDGVIKRIKLGIDPDQLQETYGLSDKDIKAHIKACDPPKKRGPKPKVKDEKEA